MTYDDREFNEKLARYLVPKHIPVGQHLKWLVKRDDKIEENRKKNDLHK